MAKVECLMKENGKNRMLVEEKGQSRMLDEVKWPK